LLIEQYAVTDYSRSFEHGNGVPGIFFKYDLEAMALTIRERTTTLYQFLIRLVGVVGKIVLSNVVRPFLTPRYSRWGMDCRWLRPSSIQSGTKGNEEGGHYGEGVHPIRIAWYESCDAS